VALSEEIEKVVTTYKGLAWQQRQRDRGQHHTEV
jgi:hypothetical protein